MIIRDYPNRVIGFFLFCNPVFDWMTMSGINPELGGLRLSDFYLITMLVVFSLYFVLHGIRWVLREPYIMVGLLLLGYRLMVDHLNGVHSFLEFGPRTVFNIALFALATRVRTRRTNWSLLALWNLAFALACALPAMGQSLVTGLRLQSFYLNPNFLAFNAFHLGMLVVLFPNSNWGRRLATVISLILIILSRTRSVLLSSFWFIGQFVRRRRNLALLAAALVVTGLYGTEFLRLGHDQGVQTLNGRLQIWRAIAIHLEHINWWLGGGSGVDVRLEFMPAWDAVTGRIIGFVKPQNHYLLLLVESGFVGLLIWWSRILLYLHQLRRQPRDRVNKLVFCYVGSLLTIQLLENEIFVNPLVVLIMGLALAKGRELEREERSARLAQAELREPVDESVEAVCA